MVQRGYFITLYGINNLGKTVQAKKLVHWFRENNYNAKYLKYPIYNLKPSGPIINEQLRGEKGQTISEKELQLWFVVNRLQYQPFLIGKLYSGATVVAEDYKGTGIAWGLAKGKDPVFFEKINSILLDEDLAILFRGKRFKTGIEKRHIHENNPHLTDIVCKEIYDKLGPDKGWHPLNANQPMDIVFNDLVTIVKRELKI